MHGAGYLVILYASLCVLVAAPAAPSNVRISAITCTSAVVSWDKVDDASGYEIQWRLIDDMIRSSGTVTLSGLRTYSYTLDNLHVRFSISRQYSVEVTSIQNRIRGGTSPVQMFTTNCGDSEDVNNRDSGNINGNSFVILTLQYLY